MHNNRRKIIRRNTTSFTNADSSIEKIELNKSIQGISEFEKTYTDKEIAVDRLERVLHRALNLRNTVPPLIGVFGLDSNVVINKVYFNFLIEDKIIGLGQCTYSQFFSDIYASINSHIITYKKHNEDNRLLRNALEKCMEESKGEGGVCCSALREIKRAYNMKVKKFVIIINVEIGAIDSKLLQDLKKINIPDLVIIVSYMLEAKYVASILKKSLRFNKLGFNILYEYFSPENIIMFDNLEGVIWQKELLEVLYH